MTYLKSDSGTWHRDDCTHLDGEFEPSHSRDQLPIHEPHCQHCIQGFDFDETRQPSATESD